MESAFNKNVRLNREMGIEKTKSDTLLLNGVEYNELPPPGCLIKTMSKTWALELLKNGVLRVRHLNYFRKWENSILGDPNDGNALYHLNGHSMNTGSVNDVYAWCLSYPEIINERLNLIAEQGNYDCMVVVKRPKAMFDRISNWLSANKPGFWVHCGAVKYNRGEEVDKKTLNSQKFHYNVFQKSDCFSEDKEYRLSVTNTTFTQQEDEYIDLILGDCRDLLSIEELPNK